jgi:hypothetical protein
MKLNIKKLKQLIKEELQKESTMHDGPRPEPASDAAAARRAVDTADVVIDGVIKRLEKGVAPGVFAVAASGPLRDVVRRPDDDALIDNVIVPFRDYLYSLEKLDKKVARAPDPKQALADAARVNAKLLSQKWGQLQTAMLGMEAATGVAEGKLTNAEEKLKNKPDNKLSPGEKKKKKAIQHK